MSELLQSLWQSNIELSLLLVAVLLARLVIHKTTKVYNSYLLWLSIPVGLLLANLMSSIEFSKPPVVAVNYAVQNFIVQPSNTLQGWAVLGIVWGIVVALLLLRLAWQHFELRSELAEITVAIDIGCDSRFPIVGIDKDEFSPAVYGFIKPKIYFPIALQATLSEKQIELIIRHEEHHITQQHLWLNLFWDILVCIFWFNPLMYISRQGFRHDQELFCDYLVLNKSNNRSDHQNYGYALLSTVTATHSVSLLCSWKNFNQLEERIMNIKKSTSLGAKVAITSLAAIIVASTSLYAVSAEQYKGKGHLSSSIEDNGDSEYIWQDGDKRFIEKNGQRFTMDGDAKRPMTSAESNEFTALLEKSKSNNRDSLRHSIDDNGEVIEWTTGEISYVKDNGKYIVREGDSSRSMTASEKQTFEKEVKSAQLEDKQYQRALKKAKTTSQEDTVKAAEVAQQESFHHEEHDDGRTEINWSKDGKTMISANGKDYVIDENGKREMTSKERRALKKKVTLSQQKRKHEREHQKQQQLVREHERASRAEQRELQRAEREAHTQEQKVHAMQRQVGREQHALVLVQEIEEQQREQKHQLFENEQKQSDIEAQQEGLQTQQREFQVQWQELAVRREEIKNQVQEFQAQMHEYEIAPEGFQQQLQKLGMAEREFKEFYHDGQLGDKTMGQVERSLAIAKKQSKTDRADLKKQLQQARAGIKKARNQLNKQRASLRVPLAPIAPLVPLAPAPEAPLLPEVSAAPVALLAPAAPEVPLAINQFNGVIQIPSESVDSSRKGRERKKQGEEQTPDFDFFDSSEPH